MHILDVSCSNKLEGDLVFLRSIFLTQVENHKSHSRTCICRFTHTYMHVHMHTHIHTHACTHAHTHTRTHTHTHTIFFCYFTTPLKQKMSFGNLKTIMQEYYPFPVFRSSAISLKFGLIDTKLAVRVILFML